MDTQIIIDGKIYDLRLTTKRLIQLEARIKRNAIAFIFDLERGILPTTQEVLTILHECLLERNHSMSMDNVIDLYDKYIEEGHTLYDLVNVIINVYQECGVLKKDVPEDDLKNM